MKERLNIVKQDPWLEPYEQIIAGRHRRVTAKRKELVGKGTLTDFASGYRYYGLNRVGNCWVFREWAPNARAIYLVGDFNDWTEDERYQLKRRRMSGDW